MPSSDTYFKPGKSGNPHGRPKGFASLIREATLDGEEIIALALSIMRGKKKIKAAGLKIPPTIKERLEAMKFLADRGWGQATQQIEMGDVGLTIEIKKYGSPAPEAKTESYLETSEPAPASAVPWNPGSETPPEPSGQDGTGAT